MNENLTRHALNDFVVSHLAQAARPLTLAEVFVDVYPGQRATDSALLALRKRLTYLAAEGRLLTEGYGDTRLWSASTETQRKAQSHADREAAQAIPVAAPRRISVMAGTYVPPAGPALRLGALDFQRVCSVGNRC